jgi:hypothetical protein
MNTFPESSDALTVPGELDAIPWNDIEGKSVFFSQFDLAINDDDLSFQDTVPLDDQHLLQNQNRT